MLQCANISLSLGDRALLDEISAIINPGDRIGLVGPNGAGKSTLLKVIMGFQEVDNGSVSMGKTESLGYLPQDGVEPNFSLNVVEEVERVFQPILDLEKNVQHLQNKLGDIDPNSASYTDYLDKLGSLQTELEQSAFIAYALKWKKC